MKMICLKQKRFDKQKLEIALSQSYITLIAFVEWFETMYVLKKKSSTISRKHFVSLSKLVTSGVVSMTTSMLELNDEFFLLSDF
jgi:hypothetical protein